MTNRVDKYINNYIVLLLILGLYPTVSTADVFNPQIIQENLSEIITFCVAVSYVLGVFFCTLAVMKLKKYGEQTMMSMGQGGNLGGMVFTFLIGIFLLYLPTTINTLDVTIWGTQDINLYPSPGRTGDYFEIFKTLILAIRVVGLISFIRGWVLLTRVGQQQGQPGTVGKALLHIGAGICGINFMAFFNAVENTLT